MRNDKFNKDLNDAEASFRFSPLIKRTLNNTQLKEPSLSLEMPEHTLLPTSTPVGSVSSCLGEKIVSPDTIRRIPDDPPKGQHTLHS